MRKNSPITPLERDANEATAMGLSYGNWRTLKDEKENADKVYYRRARQLAVIKRKRDENHVSL